MFITHRVWYKMGCVSCGGGLMVKGLDFLDMDVGVGAMAGTACYTLSKVVSVTMMVD